MLKVMIAAVFVAAVPGFAVAQTPDLPGSMQFPGSLNMSITSGEPSEPGNVASSTTVVQGVSIFQKRSFFVVGFADVTGRADTEGYAWNNTMPYRAGAKLVHVTSQGVLEVAAGVMADAKDSSLGTHPMGYASYWCGWRGESLARATGGAARLFPGSAWVSSGYVTPHEARNWITSGSIEQSMTVYSLRRLGVGPFVRLSATVDGEGRPWNNRTRLDVGGKLSHRIGNGIVEGGVGRRYSVRGNQTSTTVAYVNLWMGWTPRAIFE